MALGILPTIIGAVSSIGPAVYGIVDTHIQRRKEAEAKALPEGRQPPLPSRREWVVPAVAALAVSGVAAYALYRWSKRRGAKRGRGRRRDDEE
ncbi:MAG: hypothetical protein IT371_30555 [Deltaproteobacteria bacterium]|nr:hypothetical protein [Deltaproteobacteria bacterium]